MATTLPFIFRASPLPSNFKSNPNGLLQAFVVRLSAESEVEIAVFVTGSVEPSSNVGPWLKDGVTWYVWDDVTGAYIPEILAQQSLGYIAQEAEPDPLVYTFWIELDGTGKAQSIQYYSGGAWKDVYEDTFAAINAAIAALPSPTDVAALIAAALVPYSTTAQMTTAIAAALVPYATTAATASAISAAVAGLAPLASPTFTGTPAAPTAAPGTSTTQLASTAFVGAAIAAIPAPTNFAAYPAQGVVNGQTVGIDGSATFAQLQFNNATINPAPGPFNTGSFRYIAPADGSYSVAVTCQADNAGGVAALMEVELALYKNGTFIGNLMADIDNTPSPNGARWSPNFAGLVKLVAADYLEVFMSAEDGTNAGDLTVSAQLSVHRVSALS